MISTAFQPMQWIPNIQCNKEFPLETLQFLSYIKKIEIFWMILKINLAYFLKILENVFPPIFESCMDIHNYGFD